MGSTEEFKKVLEKFIKSILREEERFNPNEFSELKYRNLKLFYGSLGKPIPFIAFIPLTEICGFKIEPWQGIYPVLLFYHSLPIQKGKYPLVVAYCISENKKPPFNWPKNIRERYRTIGDCLKELLGPHRIHEYERKVADRKIRYTDSYCREVFLIGLDANGNLVIEKPSVGVVNLNSVIDAINGVIEDYLSVLDSQILSLPLYISSNLLKTFYHALKTKPFVILSGLSGTGKTKLFESFSNFFSEGNSLRETWIVVEETKELLEFVKKEEIGFKNTTISLNELLEAINEVVLSGEGTDRKVVLKLGKYFVDLVPVIEQLKEKTGKIGAQGVNNHLATYIACLFGLRVLEKKEIEQLGLKPLDKPVALQQIEEASSNSLFLPIRPDFRDSKSLLGFYNPIQQKYQKTKLLDFILGAAKDYLLNGRDAAPYFVLFDEMNLARVEYYFADFLSLLESKRFSSVEEALKDNEFKEFLEALGFELSDLKEDRCAFTSASIPLHSEDELREPPKNLFLPPNLYFIGTVNVDETTHVFSPKVLDRAFTIEFDVGSFKDYVKEFLEGQGGNLLCLPPKEELQKDFTREGRFALYKPEEFKNVARKTFNNKELVEFLEKLNDILKRHGFPFGYRVFNEILIFIKNATTGPEGLRLSNDEALDRALLMKVLPKLYGTRKKLAPLIEELLKEICDVRGIDVNRVETLPIVDERKVKVRIGGEEKEIESPFPLTVKKLLEMAYKLSTDGYASYM